MTASSLRAHNNCVFEYLRVRFPETNFAGRDHGIEHTAAADSLRFLCWRVFAGVGTIAPRMGELGAKTPW
jgi:hypothetical protein